MQSFPPLSSLHFQPVVSSSDNQHASAAFDKSPPSHGPLPSPQKSLWDSAKSIALYLMAGALVILTLLFFLSTRFSYNLTPSVAVGLYSLGSQSLPLEHGQFVLTCSPENAQALARERGYVPLAARSTAKCYPSKLAPLMKRIQAVPGDTVYVSDSSGVVVKHPAGNDSTVSYHVAPPPLEVDPEGRPLQGQYGKHVIEAGHYWIGSSFRTGFDSRYYGPVDEHLFYSSAVPLWTTQVKPWHTDYEPTDPATFDYPANAEK